MSDPGSNYLHLARHRLAWASGRLDYFERDTDIFLSGGPYEVVSRIQPEGDVRSRIKYSFRVRREAPLLLRFRAADAIHNLRAVVDNLVWGLGQLYGADERLSLEFHKSSDSRSTKYLSKTKRLPIEIQQWIVNQQPYNRPAGQPPSDLHLLHQLWNRDKHRLPLLMGSAVSGGKIDAGSSTIHELRLIGLGPLEDGDEIAEAVIDTKDIAHLNVNFFTNVAFD